MRLSKIHKQTLKCLAGGVKNGRKECKSTLMHQVVQGSLAMDIAASNWRESMKRLEASGMIDRYKVDFDWFLRIRPEGLDMVEKLNAHQ